MTVTSFWWASALRSWVRLKRSVVVAAMPGMLSLIDKSIKSGFGKLQPQR